MPILLAEELPAPDCDPVRVRLLCEDLVAFRDTQGKYGLLDAFCAHRRAHLFFGRREVRIHCIYHGWKFDVDVTALTCRQAAGEFQRQDQINFVSPEREWGVLWATGPKDKVADTALSFYQVPAGRRLAVKRFVQHTQGWRDRFRAYQLSARPRFLSAQRRLPEEGRGPQKI
jgi:phenylpropionate dioxygenase-like ring-hydroxylating dioxygenase large terminal subunit